MTGRSPNPTIAHLRKEAQEPQRREVAFNALLAELGNIQRKAPKECNLAIRDVLNGKTQFSTPPPTSRFRWQSLWGNHKLLNILTEYVREVRKNSGIMSLLEEETQLQEVMHAFHRVRGRLKDADWKILFCRAITPFEIHFLNFTRESASLSPTHWRKYFAEAETRPENPIVKSRMGFARIPGRANWVVPDLDQFIIIPGLFGCFDGIQLEAMPLCNDLLKVNGRLIKAGAKLAIGIEDTVTIFDQPAQLGVQDVFSELPLTHWPCYRLSENNHQYRLHPGQLEPGSLGKYVVSKMPDGNYTIRFGADHHYQMLDAADIFVAGGWLCMYRGDFSGDGRKSTKLFMDGKTSRFGHLMRDAFYDNRGLVASALLTQLGYHPESDLWSDAREFWHFF